MATFVERSKQASQSTNKQTAKQANFPVDTWYTYYTTVCRAFMLTRRGLACFLRSTLKGGVQYH